MTIKLVSIGLLLLLPGCVDFEGLNVHNDSHTLRRIDVTITNAEKTWFNETVELAPRAQKNYPISLPDGKYNVQAESGNLRYASEVALGGTGIANVFVRVRDTGIDIGVTIT